MALSLISRDLAEDNRLVELHRFNILDTPPEEGFDRVTRLTLNLFEVPIAFISFVDDSREWFKSRIGFETAQVSRDMSFGRQVIRSNDLLIVPDTRFATYLARTPLVLDDTEVRFYAGAPLVVSNGQRLGTLSIADTAPRAGLSSEDRRKLSDLAAIIVDQLEFRLALSSIKKAEPARDPMNLFRSFPLAKLCGAMEAKLNELFGIAIFLRASRLGDERRDDVNRILQAIYEARQLVRESSNLD